MLEGSMAPNYLDTHLDMYLDQQHGMGRCRVSRVPALSPTLQEKVTGWVSGVGTL
jgi:hypothetical protein